MDGFNKETSKSDTLQYDSGSVLVNKGGNSSQIHINADNISSILIDEPSGWNIWMVIGTGLLCSGIFLFALKVALLGFILVVAGASLTAIGFLMRNEKVIIRTDDGKKITSSYKDRDKIEGVIDEIVDNHLKN